MESDRNILSRWVEQWIRQPPPRNPIPYPVPKNLKWFCQEGFYAVIHPAVLDRDIQVLSTNYHREKRRRVVKGLETLVC